MNRKFTAYYNVPYFIIQVKHNTFIKCTYSMKFNLIRCTRIGLYNKNSNFYTHFYVTSGKRTKLNSIYPKKKNIVGNLLKYITFSALSQRFCRSKEKKNYQTFNINIHFYLYIYCCFTQHLL